MAAKLQFEYEFKYPFGDVVQAYLNKYKFEDRYSLTTFVGARQPEEDIACVTQRHDSVFNNRQLEEEICLNRSTNELHSKITFFNESQPLEHSVLKADGPRTEYRQTVFEARGDKDVRLRNFKKGVELMLQNIKFE